MRLLAVGGDERMKGAVDVAKQAGWESHWQKDGRLGQDATCDVLLLPWPRSFQNGRLVTLADGTGPGREEVLRALPPSRLVLCGSGVLPEEIPQAGETIDPAHDELFLRRNAQLTAEGAILCAMQRMERALLGSTCLITGFGRIGQELTARLVAMGAFVIVCARSEIQMRASHAVGAHPVPLAQMEHAAGAADLILNTVPAQVLERQALTAVKPGVLILELASAPYGVDLEAARELGVRVEIEGGVPGRYAPMAAGEALFEVAQRHIKRQQEETANG
ncbi:MAG: hypothetical protein IKB82_00565 [Clostridia bacterium]|nr:hypothetical protein [Clostridia bacterium]